MKLFSIYDNTAHTFGPVVQLQNIDVAKRLFINFLRTNPDMLSIAPDLHFVCVAEFDSLTGKVTPYFLDGFSDDSLLCPDVSVTLTDNEIDQIRVSLTGNKSEVKE